MGAWAPVIEVIVRPEVAAAVGGFLAFWLVKGIKAAWPTLSVELKVTSAFLASVIVAVGTEALSVVVDGSFDVGKVIAYLFSQWGSALLVHLGAEKPLKKQAEKRALARALREGRIG